MNPYKKAALLLLRLVATGFILVGLMNMGLYLSQAFLDKSPVQIARCLYLAVPVVIGLVIMIKSPAIASRLTRDFDE